MSSKTEEGKVIEQGVMHFSLGENFGQIITDLVRERAWYDCNREAAILILVENMDMEAKLARQIIDGKKKLVTNEDKKTVSPVKDNWKPPDFKGMKKEIDAVIEETEEVLYPNLRSGTSAQLRMLSEREQAEMSVELREVKEMLKMNIWKALARAKNLRAWIEDTTNFVSRQHLIQLEQAREKVGDFKSADEPAPAEVSATYKPNDPLADDPLKAMKLDALVRLEAAGVNLDPEAKRRMQGLVLSMGKDPDCKEDPEFKYDSGWLDREGRYWGCEIGLHIALGEKLVEKFFPGNEMDAERRLESEGWMKCTGAVWFETEMKPTAEQRYTFKQWEKKHTTKKYYARSDY
jgi:hypothetical protein